MYHLLFVFYMFHLLFPDFLYEMDIFHLNFETFFLNWFFKIIVDSYVVVRSNTEIPCILCQVFHSGNNCSCCCSVSKLYLTLCNLMNYSIPVFPVLHSFMQFVQIHVHWVDDAISFSLIPFSCPQLFSASGSFPMSWLFISGGQSIGTSVSPSVFLMNTQGWFLLGVTGLVSLLSKELSRVFSSTTVWKHQLFGTQPSLWSQSHIHTWQLEKPIALTIQNFVNKVMSLLFNMLSRFFIAFLPRSKRLLILWLQSISTVIFDPKKIKSATLCIFSPSLCHEVIGLDAMIFVFWMLSFKPAFSLSSFTFIKRFLFTFCNYGGIILSEVVRIFPGNLDSILWVFQSSFSHDVLSIQVK